MFDQVVFAGGGNRCWWQVGFWRRVAPELKLRPRIITAMLYTRDPFWVMDYYARVLAGNPKNFYRENLLKPGKSVFPHYRIYRQALLDIYAAQMDKFQDAPEIRVGVSHILRWLGPRSAVAAGLIAYNIDKHWRKTMNPTLGRKLGFQPEFARVQDCAVLDGGMQARVYVQPSENVPIASWDYTRPEVMRPAYDLGWEGGARFLDALSATLRM